MEARRAFVFPGQGVAGGEVSGVVREAVREAVGDGDVPYQLSVFARSVELADGLRGRGVEPDVVAGHSLGEYAAACVAGSLGLEDGVRLVAERDRLMGEASRAFRGAMIAVVGADPTKVEEAAEAAEGVVVAANFNTPRQTVLSGEPGAVEEVAEGVGGRAVRLEVAGAFHSPLMVGAAEGMEKLLRRVGLKDPRVPVISGADGSVLETAEDVRLALMGQMLSPVRWVVVVERLSEIGVEEVVEAGDGGTLIRMLRDFKGLGFEARRAAEVPA